MYGDILSPSKIGNYLTCPEQYWHMVEAGTTARPSFGWRVGSCFHNAIEVYVKSKYSFSWEESVNWSIAHVEAFPPDVVKEAIRIGHIWFEYNVLPRISQIVGAEESFGPTGTAIRGKPVHVGLDFESGLRIRGIIDIIWRDGDAKTGTIVVGDYKTGWEYLNTEKLSTKVQAMAYALAVHKITKGTRNIRVEFYPIRYAQGGAVVWAPEYDEFEQIEQYLLSIQRRIQQDTTHEPKPSLDCRYCSFNYTCDAFDMWQAVEPPGTSLWEITDLSKLIELYDVWNARHLSSKRVQEDLKDIIVSIMGREYIDQVKLKNGVGFKIHRRATKQVTPEFQKEMDKYPDGEMPADVALDMSQHQFTKYGSPYLQRIGSRKK